MVLRTASRRTKNGQEPRITWKKRDAYASLYQQIFIVHGNIDNAGEGKNGEN